MQLPWQDIDTVLLDMDGTLLDLHFDNHFWRDLLPKRYAEQYGVSNEEAEQRLFSHFESVEGTLDWYCLDYWDRELGMDLALMKREVEHLITIRPHVITFLDALKRAGKQSVLITNAHFRSLDLKLFHTEIDQHLDAVFSTHQFGKPKEEQGLWSDLQGEVSFDPARTLLIDDSLPILQSAKRYGIAHLLGVSLPDSRGELRNSDEFALLHSFADILPS